jgi:elongation factor Ts
MAITASLVKDLREKTSAGMLDCKNALVECEGNFDKAVEWLRKKGLSKVAKKSGRVAAEGLVESYIHAGGRVGVLIEVNSETDFVARNEEFKAFVKDISMHIAAMSPQVVRSEELDANMIEKEKEILKAKGIEEGKKPEFLDKIVEGQISKWMAEVSLLDQKYVKDPSKTVQDYLNEVIARIGENIVIRRFARYELGEGIEKKQENFAEEVAAQLKG